MHARRDHVKTDISAYDIVQNLFPDKNKDFVININETDIALVKEIRSGIESKDLEKLAGSIVDTLSSEFYTHCVIGMAPSSASRISRAPSKRRRWPSRSARCLTPSGPSSVTTTSARPPDLSASPTLCDMFLKEVFKRGSIESLDQETLFTIQRFFENNLNVSETSRKLFVPQKYAGFTGWKKSKKLTGLDLREFEDAIIFKGGVNGQKVLSANPVKY